MSDAPSLEPDDGMDEDEIQAEDDVFLEAIATPYESYTDRLRVYNDILRAAKPRYRDDYGSECSPEPEQGVDEVSARNLALIAIYRDIRRIAGDGRPVHDPEVE